MKVSSVMNGNSSTAFSVMKEKTYSNRESSGSSSVVVSDQLTAANLQDLFEDRTCVLHIPNYTSKPVRRKLDIFLRDFGTGQYVDDEIRNDTNGTSTRSEPVPNIQHQIGVYRYGIPLDSTYSDSTGRSLERYVSEALQAMQAIRNAAAPYLSPIDKLRVELDELWQGKVSVAVLNGRKAFCGVGRIIRSGSSKPMSVQPHYNALPASYFPDIRKQFVANITLDVPIKGGDVEVWDVPPVDADEKFVVPDNWRSVLPDPVQMKAGPGDLLLFNIGRPHAAIGVVGDKPHTSLQSFIGLTKRKDVLLFS